MRIDCDDCVMQHTDACDDCIVTALIDRPAGGALVLDLAHERAIRQLQDEGLAPRSRFRERPGDAGTAEGTGAAASGG